MNKVNLYYFVKVLIPRNLQIALRRMYVSIKMRKYKDVWPILPGSETKPENWRGWPDGKDFAVVLTHDVELRGGHDKCYELLKIEKELGFKSSFNFVPERYKVDKNLREFIVKNGFEVGVHGLNHDGKLFRNKEIFDERAKKINNYLKDWNAVGFRAPAMHHNLDWIGNLDVEYDLSTFDTDPFEPQPDGVGTIFPFWVKGKNGRPGYLEMPYTLVQDFTLFVLMQEKTIKFWQEKTDWIAKNGGMVLVNVHPDYIDFNFNKGKEEFPLQLYKDFLLHIKESYKDKFWNPLPKEIAGIVGKNYEK